MNSADFCPTQAKPLHASNPECLCLRGHLIEFPHTTKDQMGLNETLSCPYFLPQREICGYLKEKALDQPFFLILAKTICFARNMLFITGGLAQSSNPCLVRGSLSWTLPRPAFALHPFCLSGNNHHQQTSMVGRVYWATAGLTSPALMPWTQSTSPKTGKERSGLQYEFSLMLVGPTSQWSHRQWSMKTSFSAFFVSFLVFSLSLSLFTAFLAFGQHPNPPFYC